MTLNPAPASRVESPCIKVCQLDARNVCVGCGRTLAEIAEWSRMSESQQRTVCIEAAARIARRCGSGFSRTASSPQDSSD